MNRFTISQLQQFSGIKAHTIRVWEQRYDALKPDRSEGNTRYYDDNQLRRLLNIVSLMNAGHKISELCRMSDQEMFSIVEEQLGNEKATDEAAGHFVLQLIAAALHYDEHVFEKVFSRMLLLFSLPEAYTRIIYPMLNRIGLMWSGNTLPPSREHFISNMIRQKLFSAIDTLPMPDRSAPAWLLFLPENEFHEIGLLFSAYVIRQSGHRVIYLGQNVPLSSVHEVASRVNISHALLFLVHQNDAAGTQKYLTQVKKLLPGTHVFVSGNATLLNEIKTPRNLTRIRSVDELQKQLA